MLKKVLYYLDIISLLAIAYLTIEQISFIFQSKMQGALYITTLIVLLVVKIYLLVRYKDNDNYLSKVFVILAAIYLSFIYYKIYSLSLNKFSISVDYCMNNYLLLSLIYVVTIIQMLYRKKEKKV